MTRNRGGAHRALAPGATPARQTLNTLLTLILIAPATALLLARLRAVIALDDSGAPPGCGGVSAIVPAVHAGLPVIVLLIAIPIALLSLAHRARGWHWLLGVLSVAFVLEVALQLWSPGCL